MKLRKFLLLFLLISQYASAQDPSYSLNFSVPYMISPTFAGLQEAKVGSYFTYRMRKLTPIENYSTVVLGTGTALDYEKLQGGAGLLIINDNAGGLRTTEIHGIFAYEAPFGKRVRYDHLRAAVQIGVVNRAINTNKFTFEDQFDGTGFEFNTQENFDRLSVFNMNYAISMMYYRTRKIKGNPEFAPFVGFTIDHINKPKIGFYNSTAEPLPMKYTFFGGGRMYTRTPLDVNGYFIANFHNYSYLLSIGGSLRYVVYDRGIWFKKEKAAISAGFLVRPGDTFMTLIGMEFSQTILVSFSYDLLTSKYNIINKNFGGLQIAARYNFDTDFFKRKPELPFPDF